MKRRRNMEGDGKGEKVRKEERKKKVAPTRKIIIPHLKEK